MDYTTPPSTWQPQVLKGTLKQEIKSPAGITKQCVYEYNGTRYTTTVGIAKACPMFEPVPKI